ncbi:uracil-DNA glycosylase [Candidatus Woesearchaeota archaeon]|jgi:uracil-DNA glycosylase|nr:uracil-DNA glycosylase [Candidatus Woesearchaeota archaeon]MBT5342846.1 uracil-DNA glycosylase [Candidatus Woesearchaeota archaeon]
MKDRKLYDLAEDIRKCTSCPLSRGRTLAVPGEGKIDSGILIVGEAPGAEEDRLGQPFVGRAGKLLNELLETAGIDRSDVFITNCVKCRPPKNRNPNTLELKTCKKWLDSQIALLKPKLIIILGRVALKNLTGKEKIKDLHGKVSEFDGQKYFVTYHPSAGLRFKWIKEVLFEDAKNLKKILAHLKNK